ncbi:er degradation-enhancing alpha-mannosidase-like protein [Plasmopara halstedii]|uniref:alpha-1,2-Mannosidase n=1 Tax=Plasmopara halstedii TaxID=4781 RepID=A0A0N7L3K7_PLAHL|nr:er degradation-enhancing alpha-mannosidase-like protein [Plasmopara halstedii]CEG36147.1 er degradation-enhancing alpha-mannosidase-like protein [Plasmopara halstedii]|eukprot:XP_024572516.1 er degradation-enhancing alpha-mannosidase-like protein [Plasmopara halstedii]
MQSQLLPRQPRWNVCGRLPSSFHAAATVKTSYTYVFLMTCISLLVVNGVAQGETQAEDSPAVLSHFNGLHTLSGDSYRAFKNRLKRTMRGESCLRYHVGGAWWHYEWCFDQYVRQFHPQVKGQEKSILLGTFDAHKPHPLRVLAVDNLARLADPDRMGYMAQQQYNSGDLCEYEGTRRSVKLQVKCCALHDNEAYIDSVEEKSQCEYELNVCSPVACGLMQRDQFVFTAPTSMDEEERMALTQTVKEMFYHAYNGYMANAFPQDDLLPLSCKGGEFELGRLPMLTLIDTLDTLALLEDATEFRRAVELVVKNADFNMDTEVSVFETTIRILGGLLSAHLFAIDPELQLFPNGGYDGTLLLLAVDLGDRLLPAFDTATGIPIGTVNLRHGVPKGETPIASTAGAGSLSIEFTMLSVLTGDPKYAVAARGAVRALFIRRSKLGLLGKHINTTNGEWTEFSSGPGTNSDSFYEYLMKMYELFGDQEALDMFTQVYPAVLFHNKHGDWYTDVSMYTGCHGRSGSATVFFENLAAFWPGMQVAAGDIKAAADSMNAFYHVWRDYGFLSEHFNVRDWKPLKLRNGNGARYPLRPELIESTFYMHEATNDSSWLRAGAHVVHSLQKYTKTSCGYASIADVETKKQEDYMPSFFLSETCKYLYLLFNTTHFFRQGNYVMTTEAHPLPILPTKLVKRILDADDAYTSSIKAASSAPFSAGRVMQCKAPKFYELVNYSLRYEGEFVARTTQCLPRAPSPALLLKASQAAVKNLERSGSISNAMSELKLIAMTDSDTLKSNITTKSKVLTKNQESLASSLLKEWLPALEHKLQKSIAKNTDIKWLEKFVKAASYSDESMTEQDFSSPLVQYLYGGIQLGEFRVEQLLGRVRVTREETGDWIDVATVAEGSQLLIGIGFDNIELDADSYTLDDEEGHDNDYRPPNLGQYHVYKVEDDLTLPVEQHCSLHVQIDKKMLSIKSLRNATTRPTADSSYVSLTVPCVGANFGATSSLKMSRAFPEGEVVIADPIDGCDELSSVTEEIAGNILLVQRGKCFFEKKAENAMKWGAAGIIIVNNEENDLVLVMEGVDKEAEDASNEILNVPVVMVSHRLGEWFETHLTKTKTSTLSPVKVSIEVNVRHHNDDSNINRKRTRSLTGDNSFPRVVGKADNLNVYGPLWGIELLTKERNHRETEESEATDIFTIAIIDTPPW